MRWLVVTRWVLMVPLSMVTAFFGTMLVFILPPALLGALMEHLASGLMFSEKWMLYPFLYLDLLAPVFFAVCVAGWMAPAHKNGWMTAAACSCALVSLIIWPMPNFVGFSPWAVLLYWAFACWPAYWLARFCVQKFYRVRESWQSRLASGAVEMLTPNEEQADEASR